MSPTIELVDAKSSLQETEWLTRVYPLYLYDLSAFGNGYYALTDDGEWEPDHLPAWLGDPNGHPLVIKADGQRVGFSCVGTKPFAFMSSDCDARVCEFFILHQFRRIGIGRAAAKAIFHRYHGIWEVTELQRNTPAIAFWRTVIHDCTNGAFDETKIDGELRQVFTSA